MKKKWRVVLYVVAAAVLGASLAGNCFMFARFRGTGRRPAETSRRRTAAPETPKPPKAAPDEGGNAGRPGYAAKLPETPILFRRAGWNDGSIQLDFESASRLEAASVSISPQLPIKAVLSGDKLRIHGKFTPGTKYRVTVVKGARNASGGVLENDLAVELQAPDLQPGIGFATEGVYLPLNGKKLVLPFRSVNCDKAEVTVYKAFDNNLNPYRTGSTASDLRMIKIAKKKLTLKTPRNREVFHELDLAELLGGRKPGVYRVVLDGNCQYVSVTDMAVQVAEDAQAGRVVVFVRSLSTGKPVAGAEISVLSYKNQLAASGKTDENGCATLSYDPAWAKESDHTNSVLARKDGDLSFFLLRNAKNFDQTGDEIVTDAPRAFVFAERGIARPGEKFTASTFLRREQNGTFKPMADTVMELQLLDPSYDKMFSRTVKSDAYGFAQLEFGLPETAETGIYTVVCKAAGAKTPCGRTTIRVASFVPDRIKVSGKDLQTGRSGIADILEFEFDAKYYFGAPLEEGAYQYYINAVLGPVPAHWDKSWTVGAPERFVAAETLFGKGKKSKGGVRIRYPGFSAQGGRSFNPVQIVASFEAAEPGGRNVTGRVWKNLCPTPFFIGLREAESNGRDKRFEYTLLPAKKTDSLRVTQDLAIKFELTRKEWEYVLSRTGSKWKREWVRREIPLPERTRSVTVPAGDFAVGKLAAVAWDLPSGEYTLTASSGQDLLTQLDFSWYSGEGGERSANPSSIYFRTDAERVAPGGKITFSFDADGDGEAFLVFGERALAGNRTIPVKSGKNTVTLSIPENLHSSSYFIGCTVVTRRDGTYRRSFGVLKVNVDQTKSHRLDVALNHAPGAEPESQFDLTVALKDAAGQPRSGAVCLYAVDSGVVSLTEYKTPDIFKYFYGDIACPMAFYDMYGLLFDDLKITPDGRIGGDAAARKLGKIKQKHTVRLISPLLVVPASGTAKTTVKLPDHTGALTIFAVASSEDAAGSAQSSVIMRKPVTVALSAPRYIAPGDVAELSLTLFNHEAAGADYSCAVELPPELEVADGASAVLTGKGLEKGKQTTRTLKVRARERFGSGKISARLTVGKASAKDDTFITVRSVNVHQSAYRFAVLKPGESFKAEFSADYIGDTSGAIRIAASPALAVKNALEWLNDYPHGCLEQTTAGAFPFLALPALTKVGLIDEAMANTQRHKAAGAYASLLAMSLSDGSFAMWPGGRETWSEATVFALHFIFEAEKRGMLSPGGKRNKYLGWLRAQADNADPERRALRAYAVYVLAVADDRSFVAAARNLIEGTEKPDFALFLAGAALVKGGYATLGTPAMRDALAAKCYLEENVPTAYSDKACRLGMALYILMDCAVPDEELATRLAFELAGTIRPDGSAWGTTQANAWAALGLAAYAEKFSPTPALAEISAGGKSLNAKFSGVKTLPAESGTIVVNRSAKGSLIVDSLIRGIPRKTPPTGGRIAVSREYLNEKGEAVTTVRHGDKVRVRIRFESPEEIESLVIADLLPAGLEIEDELLASRAAIPPKAAVEKYGALLPKRLEKRDDRFLVFGDTTRGKGEVTYQTRAVIRGSFVIPPVHAEAMYKPDTTGIFNAGGTFTVK